jgi:uncharacterized membrane protein YfcA
MTGDLVAVGTAGLLAGVVQAVSGFGLSIVLAPILQLAAPGAAGVRITNLLASIANSVLLLRHRGGWLLRPAVLLGVPALVVVLALSPLISSLGERTVSLMAGSATLVAVLVALADRHPPWMAGDLGAVTAGAFSGALTVSSGAGGPPIAVHVGTRHWTAKQTVATVQLMALPNNIAAVVASPAHLSGRLVVVGLLGVALGTPLGMVLQGRLAPEAVRRCVLLIGLAGSVLVLVRAW